jgi:hypothetical protein
VFSSPCFNKSGSAHSKSSSLKKDIHGWPLAASVVPVARTFTAKPAAPNPTSFFAKVIYAPDRRTKRRSINELPIDDYARKQECFGGTTAHCRRWFPLTENQTRGWWQAIVKKGIYARACGERLNQSIG